MRYAVARQNVGMRFQLAVVLDASIHTWLQPLLIDNHVGVAIVNHRTPRRHVWNMRNRLPLLVKHLARGIRQRPGPSQATIQGVPGEECIFLVGQAELTLVGVIHLGERK